MAKRPRPPRCWAARPVDKSPIPRVSGWTPHNAILHPDEFKRLVALGVIDSKGRRLDA